MTNGQWHPFVCPYAWIVSFISFTLTLILTCKTGTLMCLITSSGHGFSWDFLLFLQRWVGRGKQSPRASPDKCVWENIKKQQQAFNYTTTTTTATATTFTALTIFTAVPESSWKFTASGHKPSEAHFKQKYYKPWLTQKQQNYLRRNIWALKLDL